MLSDDENRKTAILTVDVEDNFTREELVLLEDWDVYEKQVVENTESVVALLKELDAEATFFVLGRMAERHPEVVENIAKAGYEIGSHGYAHELVGRMAVDEFDKDIEKSLACLTRIVKTTIKGYRARSFSITRATTWAIDILRKYGFEYDASMKDTELQSHTEVGLPEFPISTKTLLGKSVALSGGIALRLMPLHAYLRLLKRSASFADCPMIYFHTWEFNKDQPERKVGILQSLSQASFTFTTPSRIRELSKHYRFVSVDRYIRERAAALGSR